MSLGPLASVVPKPGRLREFLVSEPAGYGGLGVGQRFLGKDELTDHAGRYLGWEGAMVAGLQQPPLRLCEGLGGSGIVSSVHPGEPHFEEGRSSLSRL